MAKLRDGTIVQGDETVNNNLTVKGKLDVTGAITGATIDTGQGATEVHLMNQNLRTTDSPTFASVNTGNATVGGTLGFASLNPDNSTETSIELSEGESQVLPKGAYAMSITGSSIVCQIKYGSNWINIFANPGGFVISDGVNFRLSNESSKFTDNVRIRKW